MHLNKMTAARLLITLVVPLIVRDQPLSPAWSPDHQTLATTTVPQAFATPEGGDYRLLLNGRLVYPKKIKRSWFPGRNEWHTFLSGLEWSPDSQRLAFVEKIYGWEYNDPFNRDFEGTTSHKHFRLTVVSRDGQAIGCELSQSLTEFQPRWLSDQRISLNGKSFEVGVVLIPMH